MTHPNPVTPLIEALQVASTQFSTYRANHLAKIERLTDPVAIADTRAKADANRALAAMCERVLEDYAAATVAAAA